MKGPRERTKIARTMFARERKLGRENWRWGVAVVVDWEGAGVRGDEVGIPSGTAESGDAE